MIEEFLEDKEIDSVLAELVDTKYGNSARTSLLRNTIREHKEGKKTFEELKSTYNQLVEKGMDRNVGKIFLIAACLREPNNPSAKDLLKDLIHSDGTTEQSEFRNGEIILACLENGDYRGALEIGANKLSRFTQKDFLRIISSKQDVDLFSALFRIAGRVVNLGAKDGLTRAKPVAVPTKLCLYLKDLYSTGSDEERQFVVDVFKRVVTEDKPRVPMFAFPLIEQLATLTGAKVPEDYGQRFSMHSEAALKSLVSEGDLTKVMDFIAKSEGEVDCSVQTLESIVKLINLVDVSLCTGASFMQLLARNSKRLTATRIVRDLVSMTTWRTQQFDNLTRIVMSSEMRDVQRALVSTASLSKQSVYIPVALVGYLAANPNDVGYVKRILGQTVERRTRGVSNNKNTLMAMLIRCTRLQPERLNATEAIRKKVLTIMAQKIRSDSGSIDDLLETLEDFGTRFDVPKDVIGSIAATLKKA